MEALRKNFSCTNTFSIICLFLRCRKTNLPETKEAESSFNHEYRICENAFGHTLPFIDDSHIDSTEDEASLAFCCNTIKPPLERTTSAKQQSKNEGARSKLQSKSQIMPHICPNSIRGDEIDNQRIIESSSMGVKGSLCPSNKEYRANIEKNCLNLNPYTREYNIYEYKWHD